LDPWTPSPIGEVFRARLRQFPSLVNCCTIDWFNEWPAEALESVATRFLNEIPELECSSEIIEGLVGVLVRRKLSENCFIFGCGLRVPEA
jgi:dynein heavy chain